MKRSKIAWILIFVSVIILTAGPLASLITDNVSAYTIGSVAAGMAVMALGVAAAMKDAEADIRSNEIEIKGPMMDETIPYDNISGIEFRTEFKYGLKLGGYDGISRIGGSFSTKEFPRYKVAGYAANRSFVIIYHSAGVTAFNAKTEEETRRLYEELRRTSGCMSGGASCIVQDSEEQTAAKSKSKEVMMLAITASIAVPAVSLIYFAFFADMYAVESMVFVMLIGASCPLLFLGSYMMWERRKKIVTDNVFVMLGVTILLTLIMSTVPLCLLALPSDIEVGEYEGGFSVRAPFLDETIYYDDITSAELRDVFDRGTRTNGFGGNDVCSGIYRNAEFGEYRIAIFTDVRNVIVIHHGSGVLVFNQPSAEETNRVFSIISRS